MEDEGAPQAGPQQQPQQGRQFLQLPAFWPDTPASWFALAESRFRLRNVTEEATQYDYLVSSLPKESVRLVLDLVEVPPEANPYTTLKARLLSSHQLTNFQKIEQLHQMGNLGDRKPSELLAQMLELCPRGQEANEFFLFLFLQRLPKELRIMLGDDPDHDARALAAKADKLWAYHSHQQPGSVAAVAASSSDEDEPSAVAAIRGPAAKGRQWPHQSGRSGGGSGGGSGNSGGNKNKQSSGKGGPSPAALARNSSGLCIFHWRFSDKAHNCVAPCSWQGN
jgi:hypothetical protein